MHIKLKPTELDHPYKDPALSVKQNLEREKRALFVDNIAVSTEKQAILKLIKSAGKAERMWMKHITVDSKEAVGLKNKHCFVLMANKEEAQKAADELNNSLVNDRHLYVALAGKIDPEVKDSVWLFNLDEEIDEEEIRILLSDCGTISAIKVVRNAENTKCLGQAMVSFKEKLAIQNAIQAQGKFIREKEVRIVRANEVQSNQVHSLQANSIKNTLFAQRSVKSASPVPKTAEEIEEDQRQMKQLLKTSDADNINYSIAMMNNVFKHQGVVPNSKIKKRLKNLKKQNLEGSALTERTKKIMDHAQKRLNQEYFEKDNLLKERRELRKKKKHLNTVKFKKSMKGQSNN